MPRWGRVVRQHDRRSHPWVRPLPPDAPVERRLVAPSGRLARRLVPRSVTPPCYCRTRAAEGPPAPVAIRPSRPRAANRVCRKVIFSHTELDMSGRPRCFWPPGPLLSFFHLLGFLHHCQGLAGAGRVLSAMAPPMGTL